MKARSTLLTSLALSLSLLAGAGCKKKDDAASTDKGTAGATAAKPDEAKPAGGKPLEMEAPALFEDYNKPGQDGMALLDKWRAGAVVTGTVTRDCGSTPATTRSCRSALPTTARRPRTRA